MSAHDLLATPEEGAEILRILESSPAEGGIELLYTRRPDAYLSYEREFGESRVFVSRSQGKVVGTCAELIRSVYIGGKPAKAAYLCGLKKDASDERTVGFDARLIRSLVREDIDCYFCSVVSDNKRAQAMFGKPSRLLEMHELVTFTTHILSSRIRLRREAGDHTFRRATAADAPGLLEFLRKEGSKKNLFPVIDSFDAFYGLKIEDFYLLESGGAIVCAAALWNQTAYKQYIVKQYRGLMRGARLLNPLLSWLGYMKLPRVGQSLDFPMLAFFLCADDNLSCYKAFLYHIRRVIAEKYDIFVIGVPKNHFAAGLYDRLPSVHFDTKLYAIRFLQGEVKAIDPEKLYPECGLL